MDPDGLDLRLEVETLLSYLAATHENFKPFPDIDIPELESAQDFIARMKAKDLRRALTAHTHMTGRTQHRYCRHGRLPHLKP